MQLTLVPSEQMDRWAQKNRDEHRRIRLSRRARKYLQPSDWKSIYLKVHGDKKEDRLRIAQASKRDISTLGPKNTKSIGFVTTETYNELMTTEDKKAVWISENIEKITIGADPEFVLVSPDTGVAEYGDYVIGRDKKYDPLGSDGPCAELRPTPTNNVEGLVENIQALFKSPDASKIDKFNWIGGATFGHPNMSRVFPIGGHIHFGLPKLKGAAVETNTTLQRRVARILDEMVALPLVKIDTPRPDYRRNNLHYGKFEDIRAYNYKFEWRVPSGLWLVHKELAHAVLGTAKAVVEESWKRYADRDCDQSFMLNTLEGDSLIESFGCEDTEKIRQFINGAKPSSVPKQVVVDIHKRMKNMSTYCVYKDYINAFIKICNSQELLTSDKLDLKRSWLNSQPL